MNTPSPQAVMEALTAYQRTAALKAAIALDLFSHARDGADAAGLARSCGAAERGVRILCDTLTVMGFLQKADGRYALTPESAAFLDRASPMYIGSVADFLASPELMANFLQDPAAFVRRGGAPPTEGGTTSPDNPVWVTFARAMAPLMAMPAELLADHLLQGARPRRILDIAAGHGLFGIALARRLPEAELVALDWAKVVEVAAENAATAGLVARFRTIEGSAFEAGLGGPYDLILLTNFLHHFDADNCVPLLEKCRAALAPEGRVAALEFVPEEDRVSPPMPASFAFVMLASTPAGDAHTRRELEEMYRRAGYSKTEFARLPPTDQAVIVGTR
jgi:SAM-dependent methyltransferase